MFERFKFMIFFLFYVENDRSCLRSKNIAKKNFCETGKLFKQQKYIIIEKRIFLYRILCFTFSL